MKSEIRKDYLLDKYVIIAPGRSKRPQQFTDEVVNHATESPFTPDKIAPKLILDSVGRGSDRAIAIENMFSAVTPDNKKAYGFQEVVIETPFSDVPLGALSVSNIDGVIALHAKRTKALMKKPGINYVLCFKNQGVKAGASIRHAHSQILASSFIPWEVAEEAKRAAVYRKETGRGYYSDLIEREMKSTRRIFENKRIAVFSPYASAYHYEACIMTKRPVDNITRLTLEERRDVAKAIKKILATIDRLKLDYNFFYHQVISDRHQHFCLKIEPRDSIELGSGLIINSIAPERAAREYRKAF